MAEPRLTDAALAQIDAWAAIVAYAEEPIDAPMPGDWEVGEDIWDAARWNAWRATVRALVAEVRQARATASAGGAGEG